MRVVVGVCVFFVQTVPLVPLVHHSVGVARILHASTLLHALLPTSHLATFFTLFTLLSLLRFLHTLPMLSFVIATLLQEINRQYTLVKRYRNGMGKETTNDTHVFFLVGVGVGHIHRCRTVGGFGRTDR